MVNKALEGRVPLYTFAFISYFFLSLSARGTDLTVIPTQTQGWFQDLEASTFPIPSILLYISPQFTLSSDVLSTFLSSFYCMSPIL